MIEKYAILALVFDVDGTLLDTREFIYQAFEHTFDTHGLRRIPREEIGKSIAQPLFDRYRQLAPGLSAEALCRTHRAFQADHLDLAVPFKNTVATLGEIQRRGIKMAVVTSRSKQNSIRTMELAGIRDFFEVIISLEDVTRPKPFPDGIKKALDLMRIDSRYSAMVGDMEEDMQAGKNAKVITVGATYGFKGISLALSRPDYVINDIQELVSVVLR